MKVIQSADWIKYNANNRGNDTSDCVVRSISMAFNIPYNDSHKKLIQKQHDMNTSYKYSHVFGKVIQELGGGPKITLDDVVTVSDFIDTQGQDATLLLSVSRKPRSLSSHLTCSVDGKLYDSWDCLGWYVNYYWVVEGVVREFTDIQSRMELLSEAGQELISNQAQVFINKYNLPGELRISDSVIEEYSLRFKCSYKDDTIYKAFSIVCPFSPTTTEEEARKKLFEIIRVRLYDRFYEINKKELGMKKASDLFYDSGYTDADRTSVRAFPVERRFLNSLPEWIHPFIRYVNIDAPGQYSDSYQLEILPIKGDPKKPAGSIKGRDLVEFYGYDSNMVKEEVDRYKRSYERPGYDYDPVEEYY